MIKAAIATGQAPYNGIGIWGGSRSIDDPVDGNLWIGGYDSSRVAGPFTEYPAFNDCFSCLTVVNMTYDTEAGSFSMFSNSTETFQIFLDPWELQLEVPPDVFQNFAKLSNGSVLGLPTAPKLLLHNASSDLGNVTVYLQDGKQASVESWCKCQICLDLT